MGTPRFTPEFKEEAVRQITERGYSVAEVSDRPSGCFCAQSLQVATGYQA